MLTAIHLLAQVLDQLSKVLHAVDPRKHCM